MSDRATALEIVDGLTLFGDLKDVLQPGELVDTEEGGRHRLPRYFYRVPDEEVAWSVRLAPHFFLAELIRVDLKEADAMRTWPRYVPCAITLLAGALESFRAAAGEPVYVAVNGGYRSPGHARSSRVTPHLWGTATDVYRVGSTLLQSAEAIDKYGRLMREVSPEIEISPLGMNTESSEDHLHADLGYLTLVPRSVRESEG